MIKKKIAVLLSGCGNKDGAEITEAVSLIICLSRHHADVDYFSLDEDFLAVNFVEDISGKKSQAEGTRNILCESARITRSKIKKIQDLEVNQFDALALPGGYGVAKNFSNWAEKGSRCEVNSYIEKVIKEFYSQQKPIAAICIAPAIVARVLGRQGVNVTLGNDLVNSKEIEKTGAVHIDCPVDDFVTDRDHKIITTPAYMYDADPHLVFAGIEKLVNELMEMA
jgi:enhancing lycopene biosynthesis protein 2